MAMPLHNIQDLYNIKPRDTIAEYIDSTRSMAAPAITTGFLNTVSKRNGSELQQAIQNAESNSIAKERDLAGQLQQRQQQQYAAEGNARMQLLQKSNEIAGQINDITKNWDYTPGSIKYQNQIKELMRQKGEIDTQLEASTKALTSNPLYQNETLVMPVSVKSSEEGADGRGAIEIHKDINSLVKNLSREQTDEISFGNVMDYFEQNDIPVDSSVLPAMRDEFKQLKAERQQFFKDKDATEKAKMDLNLAYKKFGNDKIELAKRNLELTAEFNQAAQAAKTNEEFVKMLEGKGFLEKWAKSQGLDNTTAKNIAITIFGGLAQKQTPEKGTKEEYQ